MFQKLDVALVGDRTLRKISAKVFSGQGPLASISYMISWLLVNYSVSDLLIVWQLN